MKKIMLLLVVTMLLLGVSGQAMAAFENGELIRVVWSSNGTMETATDLGSITSLTAPSTANVIYNTNNFDLGAIGGTAADSYVTYFALTLNPNPKNQAWIGGPATGQTATKTAFSQFNGAAGFATGQYQVTGAGAKQVTLNMVDVPNSFWNQLNASGAGIGKMKAFIPSGNAATSLSGLSTAGYVDSVLYYYGSVGGSGSATGLNVATIRTFANGHTELNPSAVPIPAAVYLFGSGLLSLVGIRRKMAA